MPKDTETGIQVHALVSRSASVALFPLPAMGVPCLSGGCPAYAALAFFKRDNDIPRFSIKTRTAYCSRILK